MEKIGLIAGRGNFPIFFASEAKKAGYDVIACAVKANTRKVIRKYVSAIHWIKVTELKKVAEIFKKEKVSKVVMAGQINPFSLFSHRVMSNPDVQDFFCNIQDRRADTIFKAFAENLEKAGLDLLNSTSFLSSYMPEEGVLTKRSPTIKEYADIELGLKAAKCLGGIDIGQSVCIKDGVILALEAIEGTDNVIRRARALIKSAIVLVKTSKPMQDMRFDVPVVGLRTIQHLPKGSCLAIEAKKTLFLDREEAICLANKKEIAISVTEIS